MVKATVKFPPSTWNAFGRRRGAAPISPHRNSRNTISFPASEHSTFSEHRKATFDRCFSRAKSPSADLDPPGHCARNTRNSSRSRKCPFDTARGSTRQEVRATHASIFGARAD